MYNADYSGYDPLTRKMIVYEIEMESLESEKERDPDNPEISAKLIWLREKIDQIDNIWTH